MPGPSDNTSSATSQATQGSVTLLVPPVSSSATCDTQVRRYRGSDGLVTIGSVVQVTYQSQAQARALDEATSG